MSGVIKGIKLIKHSFQGVNNPDDTSYPFKVVAVYRPPTFMEMGSVAIAPTEEIIVRAMTLAALTGAHNPPRL